MTMISINLNETPKFVRPELLLHPTIPPSLFGVNPRSIKGPDWWNETRRQAYKTNNYCCWACGIPQIEAKYHQWLEAHECYEYAIKICRATFVEVVALCHRCHSFIHKGRSLQFLQSLPLIRLDNLQQLEAGRKILDVFQSRAAILKKANLPCPGIVLEVLKANGYPSYLDMEVQLQPEGDPNWGLRWRLLFENQLYPQEVWYAAKVQI